MQIKIEELRKVHFIDKAIIHSLDMSLYYLSVVVGGHESQVVDGDGNVLSSRNKQALQDWLEDYSVRQVVLRHSSAYDEMIGQPLRDIDNQLEVPLG